MKDLAANAKASNVALFFGAPNNLQGVPIDIRKNNELFSDPTMAFGFEVNPVNLATKAQILEMTTAKAAAVGADGTLLWYFSGHGAQDGAMYTEDQQYLYFNEVTAAMRSGRATPLKRLIVVLDNCFSGINLEGPNALIPQARDADRPGTDAAGVRATTAGVATALTPRSGSYAAALYEQALVIDASRATEESEDSDQGGIFSEGWRKALRDLHGSPQATLGDMAKATTDNTRVGSNGDHTPVYRALPSDLVLNEKLFGATPAGLSEGASLVAAVGDVDSKGATTLYVAAPIGATKVELCRGSVAACAAAPTADLAFGVVTTAQRPGLTIFAGRTPFLPVSGAIVTLRAFDANGQLLTATAMRFDAR